MRPLRAYWLLLLLACACFASISIAGDEFFAMPKVLVDHARSQGCDQITDFYKRPTVVNPPYIIDPDFDDPEPGFAYWCQRQSGGGEIEYLLMINAKGLFAPFASCPEQVRSTNRAQGLRMKKEKGLSLSSFAYADNPRKKGPQVAATKPVILSEYDGVSQTFYCHEGKWLVYVRH